MVGNVHFLCLLTKITPNIIVKNFQEKYLAELWLRMSAGHYCSMLQLTVATNQQQVVTLGHIRAPRLQQQLMEAWQIASTSAASDSPSHAMSRRQCDLQRCLPSQNRHRLDIRQYLFESCLSKWLPVHRSSSGLKRQRSEENRLQKISPSPRTSVGHSRYANGHLCLVSCASLNKTGRSRYICRLSRTEYYYSNYNKMLQSKGWKSWRHHISRL